MRNRTHQRLANNLFSHSIYPTSVHDMGSGSLVEFFFRAPWFNLWPLHTGVATISVKMLWETLHINSLLIICFLTIYLTSVHDMGSGSAAALDADKVPVEINFQENPSLSYADRLLLKKHRRTELPTALSPTPSQLANHYLPRETDSRISQSDLTNAVPWPLRLRQFETNLVHYDLFRELLWKLE